MITNYRHTGLVVKNLQRSRKFYCQLLNFKVIQNIDLWKLTILKKYHKKETKSVKKIFITLFLIFALLEVGARVIMTDVNYSKLKNDKE